MVSIPLGTSSFIRATANEPMIAIENRYFEQNPTNQQNQVALLTRPGFKKWLTISGSPIDNMFYQAGCFNDALFVASNGSLYRVDKNETVTTVASSIFNTDFGSNGRTTVKMAATARIGLTPEYLWITDGKYLWLYAERNSAKGVLNATSVSSGDRLHIGSTYYQFTNGSVNAGSPDGTSSNPWLVTRGVDTIASLKNLRNAINESGVAGVDYSTATAPHPDVFGFTNNSTSLTLYSKAMDSSGNSISLVVDFGGSMAFTSSTMTGGGSSSVAQVIMPDDVGAIDLTFIAGYVVVVVGEGYGVNGRFYWLAPGDVVIDPLNFATAERQPDPLYGIKTIEDQFWLFGATSTEIWYPTGDFTTPFQRMEGKLFNRGVWPGTDLKIKDQVILVDTDGVVYSIEGSPRRVSDNSIEERIRKSFAYQKINNKVMRSWGFSVDGHDFYLLLLPNQTTLVLDLTNGQWYVWKTSGASYLQQHVGLNWVPIDGVVYGHGQETNIVAGDQRSGVLWLADASLGTDQNISTGAAEAFPCKVTGGIPARGREITPCSIVALTAAVGDPKISGAYITLKSSDDEGANWISHGAIDVVDNDFSQEFTWRSLGLIKAPGRLFEISDQGATIRIDGLDMN